LYKQDEMRLGRWVVVGLWVVGVCCSSYGAERGRHGGWGGGASLGGDGGAPAISPGVDGSGGGGPTTTLVDVGLIPVYGPLYGFGLLVEIGRVSYEVWQLSALLIGGGVGYPDVGEGSIVPYGSYCVLGGMSGMGARSGGGDGSSEVGVMFYPVGAIREEMGLGGALGLGLVNMYVRVPVGDGYHVGGGGIVPAVWIGGGRGVYGGVPPFVIYVGGGF